MIQILSKLVSCGTWKLLSGEIALTAAIKNCMAMYFKSLHCFNFWAFVFAGVNPVFSVILEIFLGSLNIIRFNGAVGLKYFYMFPQVEDHKNRNTETQPTPAREHEWGCFRKLSVGMFVYILATSRRREILNSIVYVDNFMHVHANLINRYFF